MGVKPGPVFKTVLEKVREAQLDRLIESKKEAMELAMELCKEFVT